MDLHGQHESFPDLESKLDTFLSAFLFVNVCIIPIHTFSQHHAFLYLLAFYIEDIMNNNKGVLYHVSLYSRKQKLSEVNINFIELMKHIRHEGVIFIVQKQAQVSFLKCMYF